MEYFWSLPVRLRTTILIVAGLMLAVAAIRTFQEETVTALVYIAIAVVLFWMALLGLVHFLAG